MIAPLLFATATACGGRSDVLRLPGDAVPGSLEPQWQDAFDSGPEFVLVVRPQALRADRVYGPLLRRAIELARLQSRLAAATSALDAVVDAEEVVLGLRDTGAEGTDDMLFVVRGVRGEIDPGNLSDESGHRVWAPGPDAPAPNVRELLSVGDRQSGGRGAAGAEPGRAFTDASLFELPGRIWVIATGKARGRARDALARRRSEPEQARAPSFKRKSVLADLDPDALAVVRMNGSSLVSRLRVLRPPGLLAPLGRTLATVTILLPHGGDAVLRAIFSYDDEHAVLPAEATVRHALEAVSLAKSEEFGWLRTATVKASRCCIEVAAPLPERLVNGLLHTVPALPPTDGAGAH